MHWLLCHFSPARGLSKFWSSSGSYWSIRAVTGMYLCEWRMAAGTCGCSDCIGSSPRECHVVQLAAHRGSLQHVTRCTYSATGQGTDNHHWQMLPAYTSQVRSIPSPFAIAQRSWCSSWFILLNFTTGTSLMATLRRSTRPRYPGNARSALPALGANSRCTSVSSSRDTKMCDARTAVFTQLIRSHVLLLEWQSACGVIL